MSHINDGVECCGIKEIDRISGYLPDRILKDICQDWFDDTPRAFLIFSCTNTEKAGKRLANYIKRNDLGVTHRMRPRLNPNSGNILHMWVWSVNNRKFKKFGKKKNWYQKEWC